MRIRELSFIALQTTVPSGRAYGMSKAMGATRHATIVRLRLENGVEGVGEAWGIPQVNLAYLPFLKSYLEGADVFDIEHVFARILARHYHFGVQGALIGALSGVDMAGKDAMGKLTGLPVCRLIGGRRAEAVHYYGSGGYLTENADADFEPQIRAAAQAGHPAVKIKIGVSPAHDEKRVAAARRILGEEVELLVDINANYTLDIARDSIARMAPYRIGWVEEPLSPQDFEGYGALRAWSPVPIATGEALYTVYDFDRLAARGGADVLQPDLSLCGGFWQGRQIAQLATLRHLRVSPHVWGSGIGLFAGVHFVAALSLYPHADNVPKPPLVELDLGENPLREGILKNPIRPRDGLLPVPDAPGLGLEMDWDAVEKYAFR